MTLKLTSFSPSVFFSLYSARRETIFFRESLIRKFGQPPSKRVSFSTIQHKDRIELKLVYSKFHTPQDKEYVQKIVEGVLV